MRLLMATIPTLNIKFKFKESINKYDHLTLPEILNTLIYIIFFNSTYIKNTVIS